MTNRFGEVAWCVRVNEDGEARFWEPKTAVCEELKLVEKGLSVEPLSQPFPVSFYF